MSLFQPFTARQASIALAVLRVIAGVTFIAHGAQKLFALGLPAVAEGFAKMGIPAPEVMAPFIASLEVLGGLALVFGLLTRLAALGLAFDMLGAMFFVHLRNGFFGPMGVEFVLALFAMSVALVFAGAGDYSLDGVIGRRKGLVTAMPLRSSEAARARHAA